MKKIDGDALYRKLSESDVANKLVLEMVDEAPLFDTCIETIYNLCNK